MELFMHTGIMRIMMSGAMNYIFRAGEGYRPFRRDKKYEG